MGFFKNVGKSIKKAATKVKTVVKTAAKQVSLKNAVKIVSSVDPTGIVGGIAATVQAKKDEKAYLAEQAKAQAEYDRQIAENNAIEAENARVLAAEAKKQAEYQRMLVATNGQMVGGKVGVMAGSVAGVIGKEAFNGAMQSIDANFQQGLANAGASLGNQTLNVWFKQYWWKLLLGLIVVGVGLRFLIGGRKR